jgi:formylmethanofuran dehydrogenase subunit D
MDFYKSLVPQVELIATIERTIDLEKTARFGKLSQEYFENSAICLMHPKDLKELGMKKGNIKLSTEEGSVVLKTIGNEYETSKGVVVIPSGPWANKLIDEATFEKKQLWFKVSVETTEEKIPTLDEILTEIKEGN